MALMGAELLLYPTAIGSEPHDNTISSLRHWQRVQQGHAGANIMPLIASNRIGTEVQDDFAITFYGGSLICHPSGAIVAALGALAGGLVPELDLNEIASLRRNWGVFRDRRPDLYAPLLSKDGGVGR